MWKIKPLFKVLHHIKSAYKFCLQSFHSFTYVFSNKKGSPFQTKPQLARKGSQNSPKYDDSLENRFTRPENSHQEGYKPHGGVTFRENPSSDVAIVGRGYSDDIDHHKARPRAAKRKVSKGFQGLYDHKWFNKIIVL